MPKKFASSIAAFSLLLVLPACSSGDTDTEESEGAQPTATVTVTQTVAADAPSRNDEATTAPTSDDRESAESPNPESSTDQSSSAGEDGEGDTGGTSARGNIPKEIGEPATLTASSGGKALEFSVTNISPNAQCSSPYSEPAENGSFVRIDIDATTGSSPDMEELLYTNSIMFNPYDWKFVDTAGKTANDIGTDASLMCLDEGEALPMDIGPGENVSGSLILDVPEGGGTLIYKPAYEYPGWEWTL